MTHGLKMSKMLSKADYKTVDKVVPFWQKSSLIPDELDVTLITTVSPETWNEFTTMVESWKGK
jgi:hypothetical protein